MTSVPVYISLTTTRGSSFAGAEAVKAALVNYWATQQGLGVSMIWRFIAGATYGVPGLEDVPTFFIGLAPSPSGTSNLVPTGLEVLTLDSANILVDGS